MEAQSAVQMTTRHFVLIDRPQRRVLLTDEKQHTLRFKFDIVKVVKYSWSKPNIAEDMQHGSVCKAS